MILKYDHGTFVPPAQGIWPIGSHEWWHLGHHDQKHSDNGGVLIHAYQDVCSGFLIQVGVLTKGQITTLYFLFHPFYCAKGYPVTAVPC